MDKIYIRDNMSVILVYVYHIESLSEIKNGKCCKEISQFKEFFHYRNFNRKRDFISPARVHRQQHIFLVSVSQINKWCCNKKVNLESQLWIILLVKFSEYWVTTQLWTVIVFLFNSHLKLIGIETQLRAGNCYDVVMQQL